MICTSCNTWMSAFGKRKIKNTRFWAIKYHCSLCNVTQWSYPKDRRHPFGEDYNEDVKCLAAVKKQLDNETED